MNRLVAATCVAVLAAVGYFFWGEYGSFRANADKEARASDARKELFELAQAGENERDKVVSFCNDVDNIIQNIASPDTVEMWRQVKKNCRVLGYY